MNKAFYMITITLVFLMFGCQEKTGGIIEEEPLFQVDDSNISDSLKAVFWEEANQISLRNIYEYGSPFMDSILIPIDSARMYYFAIVSVFNSNLAARDSIFIMYPFWYFHDYDLHSFIMRVDSNQTWVDSLRLTGLSGEISIDTLITKFDLEVESIHQWSEADKGYLIVMTSDLMLNVPALTRVISNFSFIIYAEPNMWGGDGDRIFAQKDGESILIDFQQRWGDCYAGCTERHGWQFRVSFQGEVEYLGSYGDDLTNFSGGTSVNYSKTH